VCHKHEREQQNGNVLIIQVGRSVWKHSNNTSMARKPTFMETFPWFCGMTATHSCKKVLTPLPGMSIQAEGGGVVRTPLLDVLLNIIIKLMDNENAEDINNY
jgi:hypothetical protein